MSTHFYVKAIVDGLLLFGAMTVYWMFYSIPALEFVVSTLISLTGSTLIPHLLSYIVLAGLIYTLTEGHTTVKEGLYLGVIWLVVHVLLDVLFTGVNFAPYALTSYLILLTYLLVFALPPVFTGLRGPHLGQRNESTAR